MSAKTQSTRNKKQDTTKGKAGKAVVTNRYGKMVDGKLVEFKVFLSTWYRGLDEKCRDGKNRSALLRSSDGRKCCVGFACLAAGLSPQEIEDSGDVSRLGYFDQRRTEVAGLVQSLLSGSSEESNIYSVNDDQKISDTVRMRKLKVLFKELGMKIVFVPAKGK